MGEKRSYFELKNDKVKFVFPEPGPLEGVKSKGKTILKMVDATFTYPTKSVPTIFDINVQVSCFPALRSSAPMAPARALPSSFLSVRPSQVREPSGKHQVCAWLMSPSTPSTTWRNI